VSPRGEVEIMADSQEALLLDPSTLDKTKHYRWVQPHFVAKRRAQGYEVVLRSVHKVKMLTDSLDLDTPEDQIKYNDCILMMCPLGYFRERRKRNKQLTDLRLTGPEERFKSQARKSGVRTLTGDDEED